MAAFQKYHKFLKGQFNGDHGIDFDTDTIKVALVSSAYTPTPQTHEFFSDITAEVTGGNYASGGSALANKTLEVDAGGTVRFKADNTTWQASGTGFTNARYAVLYKSTGVASTSPVIAYLDLGQNYGNAAGDFSLRYDAINGIFAIA